MSNGSHSPACWLRTIRRRSLAKNIAAAMTNSASERRNTPRALVRITGLSTSSGNSMPSTPAASEWTQRRLAARGHNSCNSGPAPSPAKMTSAPATDDSKNPAFWPATMRTCSGSCSSSARHGAAGSFKTSRVGSGMNNAI